MKSPNGVRAVVDIEKLRDYCLSAQHPEGRHKARVFLSVLGMASADAVGKLLCIASCLMKILEAVALTNDFSDLCR